MDAAVARSKERSDDALHASIESAARADESRADEAAESADVQLCGLASPAELADLIVDHDLFTLADKALLALFAAARGCVRNDETPGYIAAALDLYDALHTRIAAEIEADLKAADDGADLDADDDGCFGDEAPGESWEARQDREQERAEAEEATIRWMDGCEK